jgi:hypothetical protein
MTTLEKLIDGFEPFKQEFNPKDLYNKINSMNEDQLYKLNKFVGGDNIDTYLDGGEIKNLDDWKQDPLTYLYEITQNEDDHLGIGNGSTFDVNFDDIWETRFEFTDIVNNIFEK